ncbi:hypothetical protein [Saccharibacillus deserti]|uniref:hypothetical protein n=1 Tax=Saccharibacillus deserti TaxID=1634444 RepID=UPI0015581E44|nr:hypothetical protein [Saccharibacillus deserti]
MNWTNEKVTHASFGAGKVTGNGEGKISVKFAEETGEKTFMYPEAFEHYLTMSDPSKQERMGVEVREKQEQIAEGKRVVEQERVDKIERLAAEKVAARKKPTRKKAASTKKA